MIILADENIPYAREAFAELGTVKTAPGREIDRAMLAEAGMLLVRSITKVNAGLLDGTPVEFVGTATIGEDHIDRDYLAAQGIGFSSAPGCNAVSVGEYIVGALLVLAEKHDLELAQLKLGIVGVGNVGGRVLERAEALGMTCVLHDPPLAESAGGSRYASLDAILACDIVTFHVPLLRNGPYPTWHLADAAFLSGLAPSAILINTSRGPVVDNAALEEALVRGRLRGAVLDVWEGEPEVDARLLQAADIATPHIAGYSFDGKVNGTLQIYQAACRHLGVAPDWDPGPLLPPPPCPVLTCDSGDPTALAGAVKAVYDIMGDDAALRAVLEIPEAGRASAFDGLRKNYPDRREFSNTLIEIDPADAALEALLAGIGFRCAGQSNRFRGNDRKDGFSRQ